MRSEGGMRPKWLGARGDQFLFRHYGPWPGRVRKMTRDGTSAFNQLGSLFEFMTGTRAPPVVERVDRSLGANAREIF